MKSKLRTIILLLIISILVFPISSFAITEVDNGIMKIYNPGNYGFEYDWLRAFDIKGYIENDSSSTLISSTFGNHGYHTFLNVNGTNGEMDGELTYTDADELETRLSNMQYTAYDSSNEWQTIDGINLKVTTQFINNGEQLQIIYNLKNTTSSSALISLATTADVQIDGDDSATIERLDDGSGVRLWTKEGTTDKPVQFVFYGKDVTGATDVDNLWIGHWGYKYFTNMFNDNPDTQKIENRDSAFTYSWTNRTINAGETQTYSVLMEVGEINIPNTGITLDNNTKFYYSDVIINGTVHDKDLKDTITVHYTVDGTEYTLPAMATTGTAKDFSLDLTSLNLSAATPHTLKVWATDSTDCESNVEERTFTITYLKNPTLTLSEKEWTKNEVTFRITDTENIQQYVSKYQYRLNEGEWIDCDKDTDIAITENGTVKIDVRIVGTEADDYSDIITDYAKIDRVNPTTTKPTATSTTCSITVTSTQTDTHSGIDGTKTLYSIYDGSSWSEWQSNNSFTGLTHNTEYKVKTKSTDNVGNSSESEELTISTKELLIGNLILKLNNSEGTNYTENTWTNQNIYVTIEESVVGATTTYKSVEGSAQSISDTNQESTVTTDGTTTLVLSVTDGTNTITSDVEHILKVDKTSPVISEISLDNEEWSTNSKNITGKAIDSLSGIVAYQFSTESNLTSSSSGWNTITATNEQIVETAEISNSGIYYFYVKDVAGNISSVSIDSKIDATDPIINFEKGNGKTTINVTDTGSGIKKVEYAWTTSDNEPNESDWVTYENVVTYEGDSTSKLYLWARATDNVGNDTISSTTYSEIKSPTINSEKEFINEYIKFKLTSDNDDDVIYQFKIDNGEWQTITVDSYHTITNITEGNVTISARVLDNAGRYSSVSTKTVSVSITEDIDSNDENDNSNNSDDTKNNNSNSEGKEDSSTQSISSSNGTNSSSSDSTTATGKLPQTGINNLGCGIIIAIFIILAVISYRKFIVYKDI